MESPGKPIGAGRGKAQPAAEGRENYTASYIAAGDSRAKEAVTKIPSRNWGKWLLLLLLGGGIAVYAWRDTLVPWLRKNPVTGSLVAKVEKQMGSGKFPKGGLSKGVQNDPLPATGGDVTFSSGKGFGTAVPDDGSDSFRVVLPPEQETK